MSPKNPLLNAGLAALGLFCATTSPVVAAEDTPAPVASASPAPTPSVLLLYNGRVVEGQLSEGDAGYILKQKFGTFRFSKRDVEKIFGSMQAVYQYKLSRLAANDADEHIKLAKWCLAMKMDTEAREQLETVIKLSPNYSEAKAMLVSLDAQAERASRPGRSRNQPGQGRRGECPRSPRRAGSRGPPAPRARGDGAALALPVIFDLPPPLAVQRSREFAQYVHPELQKHCAKCHNERSNGSFQLIQATTRRDMTDPLLVRANMDAALKLVDPTDLAHSPLLTSTLMPHKPNNQPILLGPKTTSYRYLSTWVYSLRTPPAVTENNVPAASGTAGASAFAADRAVSPAGALPPAPTRPPSAPATGTATAQALPMIPQNPGPASPGTTVPPPLYSPQFPASYPGTSDPAADRRTPEATLPGATDTKVPATLVLPPGTVPQLTGKPEATPPAGAEKDATTTKKRAKKAVDPSVLEKFLMDRNNRP